MSQGTRSVFIVDFPPYSLDVHRDLKGSDDGDDDDQVSDLIDDAGNQDSRKGIFAYAITSKNFQILNIIVSCDSVG